MTLPRLAGTDPEGQVGLHDQIDHHYGRVYGAALLTSALTAGVQLSQPQQSALYAAPSSRQVAAGALGQTMGEVSLESARRGLDVPPTLIILAGPAVQRLLRWRSYLRCAIPHNDRRGTMRAICVPTETPRTRQP